MPPGDAVPRAAVTTAAIARILVRVVAATNAYKHCGDWPLTEPSGGGVMDGGGTVWRWIDEEMVLVRRWAGPEAEGGERDGREVAH